MEAVSEAAQVAPKSEPKVKKSRIRNFFIAIFMFIPRLFSRKKSKADEITVYSAHSAFYLWAIILTGFSSICLVSLFPGTQSFAVWFYIFSLIFLFAALIYDFNLKRLLLCSGIFLLVWLIAKYVEHIQNIQVVGGVVRYFVELDPKFDFGLVSVLTWFLVLPWIVSLFEMFFNRRKKFTPNEISEFHFGEGCELIDRTGLRFFTKYRDVLETALSFGGGDLVAVDNRGNVIKKYENIIGLFFVWNRLDAILHQRVALIEDGPVEHHE